ncbi:MAG TPA: glucose-1-phosphate adenylyltransferase subunit GlgD [Selenomonadales bacterium]|nr:glucose-1-phosphate adenylyltransferase subunit GlgD [Selenomonadales bacterium]
MNNAMGIINLVESNQALNEITLHRPLATVPFGGRYRLIDFALSGMVNSGITNVGILAPFQQRSLLDHLRSGRDWQLALKKDGLALLPPSYGQPEPLPENDVRNFYNNLDFLKKSRQEYVLVTSPNVVGNLDFVTPLQAHQDSGADITFLYQRQDSSERDCPNCALLDIGADSQVTGIRFGHDSDEGTDFFAGTFILRKELLVKLIKDCYAKGVGSLLQGLAGQLPRFRTSAYAYSGYLARIHCLRSYYRYNMALLQPEVWQALFAQPRQIYTKIRDEAPAKYTRDSRVTNAIVAGSSTIRGTVDSSVLFRRVTVGEGAQVRRSVLMSNTEVGKNAVLEHVICDKDVRITDGKCLRGTPDQPLVLKKGTVV